MDCYGKHYSVLASFLGAFFSSVSGICMKLSSLQGHEVCFALGLMGPLIAYAFYAWFHPNDVYETKSYSLCLVNGFVFKGFSTFLYFVSIEYITPGDSVVLFMCSCLITAMCLESFQLKITPQKGSIFSAVIGFTGVIFICQPASFISLSFDYNYIRGVLIALASGALGGIYSINVRLFGQLPDLFQWLGHAYGNSLFSLPFMFQQSFVLSQCSDLAKVLGLCAAACQVCCGYLGVIGVKNIAPSSSYVFRMFATLLTYLFQIFFIPHSTTISSGIGATLIVISNILQVYTLAQVHLSPTAATTHPV